MDSIGWVFIIAAVILITLSAVIVFLIFMLIGIKKSAAKFGKIITKINNELDDVNKIFGIVSMRRKLLSLVICGISFLFYAFLSISKRKKTERMEDKE
jgi:Na+(H+)/acetate symporter ActP